LDEFGDYFDADGAVNYADMEAVALGILQKHFHGRVALLEPQIF
jgi:hypothetical protein